MAAPAPDAACPHCGLTYADLRTGLNYATVYMQLWVFNEDSSTWRYKRRHTVLGFWMAIKRDMWAHHLSECDYEAGMIAAVEDAEASYQPDDEILF